MLETGRAHRWGIDLSADGTQYAYWMAVLRIGLGLVIGLLTPVALV
jgi:hypothetical protein